MSYVLLDAEKIEVALRDGRRVPARLVGLDLEVGLGVLKLALHKSRGTPLPEEWGTASRDLVLE